MVTVRCVYDPWGAPYAKRFLVERQWPRDSEGSALRLEGWLKDAAPSDELRAWFANDRNRWGEFRRRYFVELDYHPEAWRILFEEACHGTVELLYTSRDPKYNHATALKEYLQTKLSVAGQAV